MIAEDVRALLAPHGTAERAAHEKAYMKSSLEFLGAPVPAIRREAKAYARSNKPTDAGDLIVAINNLWSPGALNNERQAYVSPDAGRQMEPPNICPRSGEEHSATSTPASLTTQHPIFELRSFAIALLGFHSSLLGPAQLDWLKGIIVEASCWGHVDWLSTEALSDLVKRDRACLEAMDQWAVDPCFWVRRAAMLSLLIPLRKGDLSEWLRFCRYAEPMLEEKEFFIRKAIGWVLRETSKKSPDPVREFVEEHRSRMSGLTLREATKWL